MRHLWLVTKWTCFARRWEKEFFLSGQVQTDHSKGLSCSPALSRYSGQDPKFPQQTSITVPGRCCGKHTLTALIAPTPGRECNLALQDPTTGFSERWATKLKEPHAGIPLARYLTTAEVGSSHKKSISVCLVKVQRVASTGRNAIKS